jgi:hypothetical protein
MEPLSTTFVVVTFFLAIAGGDIPKHQEPAKAEQVAVLGANGDVLYYNDVIK